MTGNRARELAARAGQQRDLSRGARRRRDPGADHAQRPGQRRRRLAGRQVDRVPRLRRQVPRLPERRALRDGRRRQQFALADGVARSHDRRRDLGAATAAASTCSTTTRRSRRSRASSLNGRIETVAEGLERRLARSSVHRRSVHASRTTARSPSPAARRNGPPTFRSRAAAACGSSRISTTGC